ncbi:unnamed protein product [Eruca vesicaria subsp. sativa]|uniref:Uncharacterized protein n=1 Tax=Eruca vesicaria subsp. sativa TaxID=29727 RepID=A0ABC8LUT0_ERUVS|nr:unnamed protein product [Eruca vesicaria subsp. sativa]
MSQLLSSPPMSINSKTSLTHRFPEARFLTARGFIGKGHGFAVKPMERVKLTVKSRYSDSSSPAYSTQNGEGSSPRFYVGHSIYKGKAALTIEPRAPEFVALESGAFKLSKEGFLLLQFAPAAGVRQYDWSRKQVFSLSVTEIGNLVSLGPRESCVQNKLLNVDESVYIPITKAEFAVLISAFNFILPHLIGWQAFANSIKPEDSSRLNNASSPKYGGDYEWSR